MCELSLNFDGQDMFSIQTDNWKSMQFILDEYAKIFWSVVDIYYDVKKIYNIVGPMPMILSQDETKFKSQMVYEPK